MSKKAKQHVTPKPAPESAAPRRAWNCAALILCTGLFFLSTCLCSSSTVKFTALVLAVLTLVGAFLFFRSIQDRIGVPLLLLAAVVVMDGLSTLYAVSGKFALYEFLKVLAAFCLVLLLLALAPGHGTSPGRWIAKVLAGFSAIAGLVSIDMLATRIISGAVLGFLGRITPDYAGLAGVESGIRMTSMFENPNVFAGVAGLGVLLSLGLVTSSENKRERTVQTVILYINALAYLLAFSLGASAAVAVAFVLLLLLERRRMGLLILMVETLVCTVLAAAIISMTSFQAWSGVQPIPILCTILGSAALCLLDRFLGERLAGVLSKHGKIIPITVAAVLVIIVAFGLAAYNLTGGVTLDAGETLRRAIYPDAGIYTLSVESDRPLNVVIETQNQQDTMMHTSSVLYRGDAASASIEVPEDSLVVYINFSAPEGASVQSATYAGIAGSGDIPLGYKLLPGFMSNRLQGLWANQNAIQRVVFFADGLKLFHRSPVYGLGMGAFENGVKSVQSFAYVTRYAHNHYIQTMAETGVIGLALFVLLLGGCAAAVVLDRKRGEQSHPLTPALGAALVFMAAHAATEVVFSSYPYLPIAFGVFALISLCCGGAIPKPVLNRKGQTVSLIVICALVLVYVILLVCNLHAKAIVDTESSFESLDDAIALDKMEWADYALSYVGSAPDAEDNEQIMAKADKYAQRLERLDSNTVPIYLAEYYFRTGRTENAMSMVEKYVAYVSSDQAAWQQAFDLMLQHEEDTEIYRAGVLRVAQMLEDWNAGNMGEITISESAHALIERVSGT